MADFKPNIYPIIYWGLLYGLIAGFVLFVVFLLSQYLTLIWFPVFLAGVVWGGYRNYQKQKRTAGHGTVGSPMEEFKAAARDITVATREMLAEQEAERISEEEEALAAEGQPAEQAPRAEEQPEAAPRRDETAPPPPPPLA